ncbi:hypothetical protein H4R34_000152 [Dimargaris verticillata]|uniref:YTH domain-containing protein n=1 Tax=Dimargaris verticillata TaxID=2761393 RepID=A0A9W8B8N4_9FUNG|nr:hypothetical protein H4R34_000152 [Dimargaris verticillata]
MNHHQDARARAVYALPASNPMAKAATHDPAAQRPTPPEKWPQLPRSAGPRAPPGLPMLTTAGLAGSPLSPHHSTSTDGILAQLERMRLSSPQASVAAASLWTYSTPTTATRPRSSDPLSPTHTTAATVRSERKDSLLTRLGLATTSAPSSPGAAHPQPAEARPPLSIRTDQFYSDQKPTPAPSPLWPLPSPNGVSSRPPLIPSRPPVCVSNSAGLLASPTLACTLAGPQLNPTHFCTEPSAARYFVIKSNNELDVRRSIKHQIWASTDLGNERLDRAYAESKHLGPIYLFFSVNASGKFCGMAEMISNVDLTAKSSLWAQDKWNGVFRVRWVFLKDIPNQQLRHILLSNNNNKPITNSRDTQEVLPEPGRILLRMFLDAPADSAMLEDYRRFGDRPLAANNPYLKARPLGRPGYRPSPPSYGPRPGLSPVASGCRPHPDGPSGSPSAHGHPLPLPVPQGPARAPSGRPGPLPYSQFAPRPARPQALPRRVISPAHFLLPASASPAPPSSR